MSDGAASIYVALIVQVGGVILWLLSRRTGKQEKAASWQEQVAEIAAAMSHMWGERLASRDRELAEAEARHVRELASRDRELASKDALIRQLDPRGPDERS